MSFQQTPLSCLEYPIPRFYSGKVSHLCGGKRFIHFCLPGGESRTEVVSVSKHHHKTVQRIGNKRHTRKRFHRIKHQTTHLPHLSTYSKKTPPYSPNYVLVSSVKKPRNERHLCQWIYYHLALAAKKTPNPIRTSSIPFHLISQPFCTSILSSNQQCHDHVGGEILFYLFLQL